MGMPVDPGGVPIVPLAEDHEDHLAAEGPACDPIGPLAEPPGPPLAPGGPACDPIGKPPEAERGRVIWPYAAVVVAFHLLLTLAFVPWLFSWTGLVLVPLGNYLFCSLGIGAGF